MQTRLWWGVAEPAFVGNVELDGLFCVGAFGRNMASVAVNIFFTFNLLLRNVID
jgi:hypothetical protein